MERMTKKSIQEDGNAPRWVIMMVRLVMLIMWAVHDLVFAPVFGRGDGLDEIADTGAAKVSLLRIPT